MTGLAAQQWHILESRAITAGIWGVPLAPARLLDLDSTVFLAFVEGIVRESETQSVDLDEIYADARPALKPPKQTREERRAEIARFARLTSGQVG